MRRGEQQTLHPLDSTEVETPHGKLTMTNNYPYSIGVTACQCARCSGYYLAESTPVRQANTDLCPECRNTNQGGAIGRPEGISVPNISSPRFRSILEQAGAALSSISPLNAMRQQIMTQERRQEEGHPSQVRGTTNPNTIHMDTNEADCPRCGKRFFYTNIGWDEPTCPQCGWKKKKETKINKPHENIPENMKKEYSLLPQEIKDEVDKAFVGAIMEVSSDIYHMTDDPDEIEKEVRRRIHKQFTYVLMDNDKLSIRSRGNEQNDEVREIKTYVFEMEQWLSILIKAFWAGFDYHKEKTQTQNKEKR